MSDESEKKTALVYDLRVTIKGERRYFIVKVPPDKKSAFLAIVESHSGFRLEDYGEILHRGWNEPPDDLKAHLREAYGLYEQQALPRIENPGSSTIHDWINHPQAAPILTTRAALRLIPTLALLILKTQKPRLSARDRLLVSAVFRAVAIPWFMAAFPSSGRTLSVSSLAASKALFNLSHDRPDAAVSPIAIAASAYTADFATWAEPSGRLSLASSLIDNDPGFPADVQSLGNGTSTSELATLPLWLVPAPSWAGVPWEALCTLLLKRMEHWNVWTEWYTARLSGQVRSIEHESVYASCPDLYTQRPGDLNYWIAKELERMEKANVQTSNKVFVVHGHDEAAREAVARFLAQIGARPVILHEQVNQGRTVIEKVEAHGDVGFAVVLLTPDDVGCVKGGQLQPRARQNVLLELGYFVGRLGRSKVCALKRGDVEIPSDFGGVIYEDFDVGGAWRQRLGRELQAAGFTIDWNEVMNQ